MSEELTRLLPDPRFRITVVHHPGSERAAKRAAKIETHFFGGPFRDEQPGLGIDVSYRTAGARAGTDEPLPITFSSTRCDAVVLIADDILVDAVRNHTAWENYIQKLSDEVTKQKRASQLFSVDLDRGAISVHRAIGGMQHIRYFDGTLDEEWRDRRMLRDLSHAFCLLLRPWAEAVDAKAALPPVITSLPKGVQIFISHSKSDGADLAKEIRRKILEESQLQTFFDEANILSGTEFEDVIAQGICESILLVVQTDTFASREWCRREVLTAREHAIPVVVLHALREREPRSFPYLGNVPVISYARDATRIDDAIRTLLDEYLESLYWRVHAPELRATANDPDALVIPHPPDLLTLVHEKSAKTIVYPDPPLGDSESKLLKLMAEDVRLVTPISLIAEPLNV